MIVDELAGPSWTCGGYVGVDTAMTGFIDALPSPRPRRAGWSWKPRAASSS